MSLFIRVYVLFGVSLLAGCSTNTVCPEASSEAVSVCRAERACGGHTASHSAKSILGAYRDSYNQCLDRDLNAQKANAKVLSRETACKQTQDGIKCEEVKY